MGYLFEYYLFLFYLQFIDEFAIFTLNWYYSRNIAYQILRYLHELWI